MTCDRKKPNYLTQIRDAWQINGVEQVQWDLAINMIGEKREQKKVSIYSGQPKPKGIDFGLG
ncbi:hypothetical protein [Legionella rowbothamii]|uniref:hypothetical protein n=1 Tax=Legionella rowbothamii TaxID=96229 RepID=UPI001055A9FB|nr:hypothetical protein [Legionella rowbothamii]